jgi:hypothetical protein
MTPSILRAITNVSEEHTSSIPEECSSGMLIPHTRLHGILIQKMADLETDDYCVGPDVLTSVVGPLKASRRSGGT